MPIIMPDDLRQFMRELLEATGTPQQTAAVVGDSLVAANLAGHDSHGVIRALQYLEEVEKGALDTAAQPEIIKRSGATGIVDGHWGWGQPAMFLATDMVIELAREFGVGVVAVHNCYHLGRVAPYVETVARAGMVGMAMSNAGRAVAPFGGSSRVMGTNPIAWAMPRAGVPPVSLDIATAFIAEGKLRVARSRGMKVPPGAVLDIDGQPSVDPNDFYDGGALMPFGAHKGSGFSILAQVLGAGLAQQSQDKLSAHRGSNGPVIIAIDVTRFGPVGSFEQALEEEATRVTDSRVAEGFSEVLMPGEPELQRTMERTRDGIDVADSVWADLSLLAEAHGVSIAPIRN